MAIERRRRNGGHQEANVSQITSEDELADLAKHVTSGLTTNGFSKPAFSQVLRSFLQYIHSRPGPSAVAFVDRRENYVPPILDIYVLWSRPINLSSDAGEMREVTAEHAESFERFHPSLNSSLKIVDPRRYPSAEVLCRDLDERAKSAASARVVACARL